MAVGCTTRYGDPVMWSVLGLATFLLVILVGTASAVSAADQWSSPDIWTPGEHRRYRYLHSEDTRYPSAVGDDDEDSHCARRSCSKHSHCCAGHVCVEYVDKYTERALGAGRCLPKLARARHSPCTNDEECAEGLWCQYQTGTGTWSCEPPEQLTGLNTVRKKLFADECESSQDCDASARMCCQLQRRHRMAPRRVCLYYSDPSQCVGGGVEEGSSWAVPRPPPRENYYDKYGKYSYFHRYY